MTDSLLGPTTGQLTLEIDRGDGPLQTFHVRSAKCSIGSDERCEIRILGEGIRPVHCIILRSHDRTIVRRWAGNTWLNGRPFDDTTLRRGDELRLANVRIRIVADERSSSAVEHPGKTRLRRALMSQTNWGNKPRQERQEATAHPLSDLSMAQLLQRLETAESRVEDLKRQNESIQQGSDRHDSQLASRIDSLEAALANAMRGPVPQELLSSCPAPETQEWEEERQAWQQEKRDLEQALAYANGHIETLQSERQEREQTLESLAAQAQEAMLNRESVERDRDAALAELEAQRAIAACPADDIDEREAIWQAKFDELEAEREAEEAVNRQYQDDLQEKVKELTLSLSEYEQEVQDIRAQMANRDRELEQQRQQLEEREHELATLRAVAEANDGQELVELQQRFDLESRAWEEKNSSLAEQVEALEQQANEIADKEESLIKQRDEQVAVIESLTKERDEANAARDQAIAARDEIAAERNDAESERKLIAANHDDLTTDHEAVVRQRDELAAERDRLKEERDTSTAERDELLAARDEALQNCQDAETAQAKIAQERDEIITQRDEAIEQRDELTAERDELLTAREEALQKCVEAETAQAAIAQERDETIAQRDEAIEQRDKLTAERDEIITERDEAVKLRDELMAERDNLRAERDELATERSDLTAERDRLASERDAVVDERDKLAAERDKLVVERDGLSTAREELAAQVVTLQQEHVDKSESSAEVAQLQQDLAQERAENERLRERLEEEQAKFAAHHENLTTQDDGTATASREQGYVDVARDYTDQFNDDGQLAELAPDLVESSSTDPTDGAAIAATQCLEDIQRAFARHANEDNSDLRDETVDEEQGQEPVENTIPANRFTWDADDSDSITNTEQPAPVSDHEDIEHSEQEWSPVENDAVKSDDDNDLPITSPNDEDDDEDENKAGDFLRRLNETSSIGTSPEDAAADSAPPFPQDEFDSEQEQRGAGDENPFTNDDAMEAHSNTHDYLNRLGEKPDFGLALDDVELEATPEESTSDSALSGNDAEPENKNNTRDFLSRLGEKPDFSRQSDEPHQESSDSLDELTSLADEAETFADEAETTSDGPQNNTLDFLEKLGQKPDFGLSGESSEDTEDTAETWGDSSLFDDDDDDDDDDDATSPPANTNNTRDFLDRLGEKPDFGLSMNEASEDSTSESLEESSSVFAESDVSAPVNENTHDFLGKIGEKPDFGLSASDQPSDDDSSFDTTGLFDDDDESNQLGDNPNAGLNDNDEDDFWGGATVSGDDDTETLKGNENSETHGELDNWGLPIDEPPGDEAQASASSDDLVATPEQEVAPTDLNGDDDVSIEDYMNSLLARVGGAPVDSAAMPSQSPDASADSTPPVTDTPIMPTPGLMEAATKSMRPSEFVPRTKAPEPNLAAMREVANATARSAIDRAQKTRTGMALVTSVGVSLIPVFAGLILMVFGIKGYYVLLVFGVIAFLIGVYMFYRSLAALNAGREIAANGPNSTPA